MTMFKEGDNPQPGGIPTVKCYRYTFGVALADGNSTPCTADGQRAEFVFGDDVGPGGGFAATRLSKTHSGGIGVPVLAGGAIAQGADICVGMVDFTIDGDTVSLPVAVAAADADDGAAIVGKASLGSSASEADTDRNSPSIALEFYDFAKEVVGGESSFSVITLPIDLAAVAAGDVVTDWTPGFAGVIVSYAFRVTSPVTTAAKAATFNLEINGTNVTGGVLALTSANATPVGAVIAATPITAANEFDANDTVSVEASAVTAFVEGAGELLITVKAATV